MVDPLKLELVSPERLIFSVCMCVGGEPRSKVVAVVVVVVVGLVVLVFLVVVLVVLAVVVVVALLRMPCVI